MMRQFIIIIFAISTHLVVAQDQIDFVSLTYDETQNIEFASNLRNGMTCREYLCKNGAILKVGDRLVIGRPSIKADQFSQIYLGKITFGKAILITPTPLAAEYQAEEIVIDKIFVYHTKANRESPVFISVHARDPKVADIASGRTVFDLEKALLIGEIINPNAPMTRQQAIEKLKESKELLDLQIISQSQYDSIKAELSSIIIGN